MWQPDYPGSIVWPAHISNWRALPNRPRGWCLHTPEEAADQNESTPVWFSQEHPGSEGSTHYYLDNDGDVYQMVQEKWSPIANGVLGKPYPSWANPNISLNGQSLNVEIEGYAANIHNSMPVGGVQFNSLVKLIKHRCAAYGIPLDREHIIGHYQVATNRTDPGAKFPWTELIAALQEEEDMAIELVWSPENQRLYVLGQSDPRWVADAKAAADLQAAYGAPKRALSWAALQALGAK